MVIDQADAAARLSTRWRPDRCAGQLLCPGEAGEVADRGMRARIRSTCTAFGATDQVAERPLVLGRHPNGVQLPGQEQPHQQLRIAPICLDPLPCPPRDLRQHRDHLAPDASRAPARVRTPSDRPHTRPWPNRAAPQNPAGPRSRLSGRQTATSDANHDQSCARPGARAHHYRATSSGAERPSVSGPPSALGRRNSRCPSPGTCPGSVFAGRGQRPVRVSQDT